MIRSLLCAGALLMGTHAFADINVSDRAFVLDTVIQTVVQPVATGPFTVGDYTDYKLSGSILNGSAHVFVRETVAEGTWIQQDIDVGAFGKQKIEVLYDNGGKILKLIANGQEQTPPDPSKMKIVASKKETITVPKGDFECLHVTIQDTTNNNMTELWVNGGVPVGGMVKTVSPTQIGPVTLELTNFAKH